MSLSEGDNAPQTFTYTILLIIRLSLIRFQLYLSMRMLSPLPRCFENENVGRRSGLDGHHHYHAGTSEADGYVSGWSHQGVR